ncbi:MAG: transcription termination/antitermination NusG family protein [Phenylobacterium sp.]
MISEKRWYVVKTLTRREIYAAQQLENQGFATFLPKQVKTVRHAHKVQTGFAAFFPGYLFVQFDVERDRWRSVNGTFGVSHLVMQGERPIPAPVGVIEDLIAATDDRGVLTDGPWLEVGQRVRITQGPFADQLATVERLNNAEGVRVLLEIMGGQVPIDARREDLISAT